MPTWSNVEPETLLSHTSWIRELASRLVRDPNLAEDLAQETYLRALQGAPRTESSLRAWLATVLRNLVRQRARGADRRSVREAASARPEATPSTLDLVERVARHRSVVDALVSLGEPYRSTLILRYFDGLTPARIAADTQVPVSTVKTRLARGLGLLRARLEACDETVSDAWLLALVPPMPAALGTTVGAAKTGIGALLVSTQLKFAALLAALATGIYAVLPEPEAAEPTPLEQSAGGPLEPTPAPGATPDAMLDTTPGATPTPAADEGRVAVLPAERATQGEPGPALPQPALVRVEGQVFDTEGRPLSGVDLVLDGSQAAVEPVTTRSAAGGRFELQAPRSGGVLRCADPDRVTVYSGRVSPRHAQARIVVVAARHQPLAGRVVDEAGRGLSGARVELSLPVGFRARFAAVMDYSDEVRPASSTSEEGRFELPRAGAVEGATLIARLAGYLPLETPLPRFADSNLLLVMSRPSVHEGTLTGRVIDEAGLGVPDAHVSYGLEATLSDEAGFFHFEVRGEESSSRRRPGPPVRLIALKEGLRAGRLDVELDPETGLARWPDQLVLVLAGEPESIAGRVLDSEGRPLQGVSVWLDDATLFARDPDLGSRVVESVLAGSEQAWMTSETDERGRFALHGLLERSYRLCAMDPTTLLMSTSDPIEAGARDVQLELDLGELFETVSGRLLDSSGRPVVGATVHGMLDAFRLRYMGRVSETRHAASEAVVTDDEGGFVLAGVPRNLAYLRIDGEDILPLEYGRGHEGGLADLCDGRPRDLEIRVSRRMHFKVQLATPGEADALGVLDEAGESVVVNIIQGSGRRQTRRVPLIAGASEVVTVPDTARTLVLLAAGEEVRRVPLELEVGVLSEIRP